MTRILFKIYVAGLSSRNKDLIASFREVCSVKLGQQHQVQVIDILKNSAEADARKILATATIIREKPLPEKRIIGDFRENSKSQQALDFLTDDLSN